MTAQTPELAEGASRADWNYLAPEARAMLQFVHVFDVAATGFGYVSTPITTGPALVSWQRGTGRALEKGSAAWKAQLESRVVAPNRSHAQALVSRLRRKHGSLVIDPTALPDIDHWDQDDYHQFWVALIEACVSVISFADGWEYSVGCVHEFAAGSRLGLDLLDARLRPLGVKRAARLMRTALLDVEADQVIDPQPLEKALSGLRTSGA